LTVTPKPPGLIKKEPVGKGKKRSLPSWQKSFNSKGADRNDPKNGEEQLGPIHKELSVGDVST